MKLEPTLDLIQTKKRLTKSARTNRSEARDEFQHFLQQKPAANLHHQMQYFIPEWDDRVDPGFDFLKDAFTTDRDPYDDLYAHEIYDDPNYDGILVSRVVIDRSKKKRAYIEEHGLRKMLRYSGQLMGDCGAFGYIAEEKPPYTTEEIIDYYTQFGFNYGVSIDHLIVGNFAKPGVREYRYDLTLENSQKFLQLHKQRGIETFTPIGIAQGWNPLSYAEAVKELVKMGYNYIALGGLARAKTQEILETLTEVSPHLKPETRLHIFGVARIDATLAFHHLGVTSFDSSSPLRSAWLDPDFNYLSPTTDDSYIAIRIPRVGKHGQRIKRIVEAKISSIDKLKQLEQNALIALREFDAGQRSFDATLETLMAYESLLELPRNGKVNPASAQRRIKKHQELYAKLLEDKPWKKCDCKICQDLGVEVIIFRGNDRNRRRGFHNTYIFYKRFQALLEKFNDPI